MKLKALANIGGVVNAHIGQEFEVANEAMAKDLLQQGLAVPVESDGNAVSKLFSMDNATMARASELASFERLEMEKAYSEEIQRKVNQEDAKLQEIKQGIMKQAQQQAQQKFQQAEQQAHQQSHQQASASEQHANEMSYAKHEVEVEQKAKNMMQGKNQNAQK